MKSQIYTVLSLLVVLLLVVSIFQPLALTYPYGETSESYSIAHESTVAFDRTAEAMNISTTDPTSVSNLSPYAQQTFQQVKDQPQVGVGWQRIGGVVVCNDELLFCDKPTEPPEFPIDAEDTAADSFNKFSVIEDDGEVYILRHGFGLRLISDAAFASFIEFLVKFVLFGSYATFLSYAIVSHRKTHPQTVFSFAGYGVGLIVVSYAYPYAVMLYPYSPKHISLLYLTAALLLLYKVVDKRRELKRGNSS
ncbi:hypothetical protein [Natronorubrum sp. DTA28]|uniref:hypothetical protein n=1 Tax=Natronorubrum sp. DTA28 TaxID=3447019 RepID=UPI003F85408E